MLPPLYPSRSLTPGRETPFMSLHGLLDAVVKDAPLAEAIRAAADGHRTHVDLVGPPAAEAQRKKVLNIAAKEPESLDPHSSILGQSQAIFRFMYRGLTRFAIRDGKVTTAEVDPDLAESWTLSPDGTVWTFKLKKGVQFHGGFGEFTAEDVKFSFERQINKAPGTRFGVNLGVIKAIEVVDPHTVQIALKAFDPIFLLRMVGYQQGYIISKKAAEKHGENFNRTWHLRDPDHCVARALSYNASERSSPHQPLTSRQAGCSNVTRKGREGFCSSRDTRPASSAAYPSRPSTCSLGSFAKARG